MQANQHQHQPPAQFPLRLVFPEGEDDGGQSRVAFEIPCNARLCRDLAEDRTDELAAMVGHQMELQVVETWWVLQDQGRCPSTHSTAGTLVTGRLLRLHYAEARHTRKQLLARHAQCVRVAAARQECVARCGQQMVC